MATTVLSNPTVSVGATSGSATAITTQVVSAVINETYDALESTAFGQTNHTFVKGLSTATVTLTLLMDYSSASSYALLQPLVGAAATYVAIKPTSAAISGTNPEFQLTNGLLTGMDYVNGQLGELQQFEVTFQGGTLVIDTTP